MTRITSVGGSLAGFRRRVRTRRGVAMFLVIMALGVGVVLSGAMLARTESTPAVAANAVDASRASLAAHAAAEFVEAEMQSDKDWVPAASDTMLMQNSAMAGANVDVKVTNKSGGAPGVNDREVRVTITSRAGNMTSVIERWVSLVRPTTVEAAIDPHLKEFAIFARDRLRIDAGGTLKIWPLSPEATTLMPVKVGTGFSGAGNLEIFSGAKTQGVMLYRDANAGSTLDGCDDDEELADTATLPLVVPALPESLPAAFSTMLPVAPFDRLMKGTGASTTLVAGAYRAMAISNGAVATLDGTLSPAAYRFTNLNITNGSAVTVRGTVRVHVSGNLNVNGGSAIELQGPNARLELYIANGMTLQDGAIGLDRATAQDSSRSADGVTSYRSPDHLRVIALSSASGGANNPTITISQNALMLASIHAPQTSVTISNGATLLGRATAGSMTIRDDSGLYYDPALDPRTGYTEPTGPIYNGTGGVQASVAPILAAVTATSDPVMVATNLRTAVGTTSWAINPLLSVVDQVVDEEGGPTTPPAVTPPTAAQATPSARSGRRAIAGPMPTQARAMEQ